MMDASLSECAPAQKSSSAALRAGGWQALLIILFDRGNYRWGIGTYRGRKTTPGALFVQFVLCQHWNLKWDTYQAMGFPVFVVEQYY